MSTLPRAEIGLWLALSAVILLALAARLYNVNWDEGTHIHPDERHLTIITSSLRLPGSLGAYFDTDTSALNPYNLENAGSFVYGTLPVFLTKITAVALGQDSYDETVIVGRQLSALFSAATVLFIFLAGRRLYGAAAGFVAALLLAAAPLAIQHAHFYVVDPFLALFMAAALYWSVRIVQEGRSVDYVMAGLMVGLGMACKVTGALFLPVLAAAVALRLWFLAKERWTWDAALRPLLGLAAALLVAFLAFRVAQPYAFESPSGLNPLQWTVGLNDQWVEDQEQQNRLLGGEIGFPPSVQWIDRSSYVDPLQDMVRWGMGPAFGLAGWIGFGYAGYRVLRHRELLHLLPVLFVLAYFGFMGRQFSLYMRYFLPLYPVLAILAGFALVALYRSASNLAQRFAKPQIELAGRAAVALVLVAALLAGAAYLNIYTRDFTRADATRWLIANAPNGAAIAGEEWDETLPVGLPGAGAKQFNVYGLPLYQTDSPEKSEELISGLDRADYVTVSSNRLMNSLPRNPVNYPLSSRYHEMLLNGELGFDLAASFTSYPGLFGLELRDHQVQESWSSYDHPRVLIFEKGPQYSRARLEAALGQGPWATNALVPAEAQKASILRPNDLETQREGGTWTDVFAQGGLSVTHPTLVWLLALELAALAALPLALVLFRRLPDRGYLLSKPLGMLALAYPVWLLVSLKLVPFTQPTLLFGLAALLVVAAGVAFRWRAELMSFLSSRWPLVVFCELLFLAAFFLFRELRMANPDLWHPFRGGEKPMDLAYLTAVVRSTTLPPYDPWFAGGYINYYYLGQFFTATVTKLTAIRPEVAFNLAVPTFFALTVAGAFSVAYNLAAAAGSLVRRGPGFRKIPAWSPYAAGLLGVFLVAVAGNLDGVGQMVERLSEVSAWQVDTNLPLIDSVANSVGGTWQVLFHGAELRDFDYWRSSRMLPPTISITEFPFFSFLFADLHAHMMAIPFQILTIGTGAALVLGQRGERGSWREWLIVGLLGLLVGSLRWLNSWDYPPFLLLALVAVVISERRGEGGYHAAIWRTLLKTGLLVGVSFLAYQPFLASYESPVSGVIESPETTPMHQYLAHFGVFAALIGAWLLFQLARALRENGLWRRYFSSRWPVREKDDQASRLVLAGSTLLFLGAVAFLLIQRGNVFVAMLLPVMALVVFLAIRELQSRRVDAGIRLFVLALVGLGLGLSIGVDLVTLKGDINRMNTVFKFYLHTWVVYALAASFVAWHLSFVSLRPSFSIKTPRLPRLMAMAAAGGAALLLLGALLYPLFATPVRLDDRFNDTARTLDGTAYMSLATYSDENGPIDLSFDYEGIQWLRRNVQGSPVIVEGRSPLYRWGGRFSIYTGLPAVIGWDWHQQQQRGDFAYTVSQRAAEVDAFYVGTDPVEARRFLHRYSVSYVVVGRLEELYYPAPGLAKFESGLGGALHVVFENEALTIYRVADDAETPAVTSAP